MKKDKMATINEKQFKRIFNEGVEQLILPQFDRIYKKLDEHDKKLVNHDKLLVDIKEDLATKASKEDLEVIIENTERIERKLNAEIIWQDEASVRFKRLELKTGLRKAFTLIELIIGIVLVTVIAVIVLLVLRR